MKTYKTLFIGVTLIFIFYLVGMATVPAMSTLTVTAKPSADTNLPYINQTATWYNYCPLCNSYNTLTINPKKTVEVELTCSNCEADYCAVTGKDKHGHGSRANLSTFETDYSTNYFLKKIF